MRGIKVAIPERGPKEEPGQARTKVGDPAPLDKDAYNDGNVVERCFNRPKQWRAIATRSDKTARSYLTDGSLAAAPIWIKSGSSNTS